jgi:hypothetical protein
MLSYDSLATGTGGSNSLRSATESVHFAYILDKAETSPTESPRVSRSSSLPRFSSMPSRPAPFSPARPHPRGQCQDYRGHAARPLRRRRGNRQGGALPRRDGLRHRLTTRLDVAKLNMMLSSRSLETGTGSSKFTSLRQRVILRLQFGAYEGCLRPASVSTGGHGRESNSMSYASFSEGSP